MVGEKLAYRCVPGWTGWFRKEVAWQTLLVSFKRL